MTWALFVFFVYRLTYGGQQDGLDFTTNLVRYKFALYGVSWRNWWCDDAIGGQWQDISMIVIDTKSRRVTCEVRWAGRYFIRESQWLWRHSWQQMQGEVQKNTPEHGRGMRWLIGANSLSKRWRTQPISCRLSCLHQTLKFCSTKISPLVKRSPESVPS